MDGNRSLKHDGINGLRVRKENNEDVAWAKKEKEKESFDMCGRTWTFFPFFISKKNTNLQMAKGKTEPLIEWPPSG